MCFGGKSKTAAPAPTQPTRFDYTAADTSNRQQQQAAILSQSGTQGQSATSLEGAAPLGGAATLGGTAPAAPATMSY